jgi:protein TonB
VYPEIARRLALSGTVKIEITIGTDGEIKHTNVIGGHPILVNSALEALKKWKYEPAKTESTVLVQFDFRP